MNLGGDNAERDEASSHLEYDFFKGRCDGHGQASMALTDNVRMK